VSRLASLRAVLFSGERPSFYWQLWLTTVNAVGLLVVVGALFDLRVVLGPEGPTGIYQRSLYPLVPAAATLGVAVAERSVGRVAVSGGALVGYVAILAGVGVVGGMLADGQAFALAGGVGVLTFVSLGVVLGRRAERVTVTPA
jgi:hypothetical protein